MPRRVTPGCQGVYVEVPLALKAALEELARTNQRSLQAELVHAAERHVAVPPVVRIVVETPPLPPVEVEHQPKKRGRPPKQKAEAAAEPQAEPKPRARARAKK